MHDGPCASLKRLKLDVERVGKGSECGVLLEGFDVRTPLHPFPISLEPRISTQRL